MRTARSSSSRRNTAARRTGAATVTTQSAEAHDYSYSPRPGCTTGRRPAARRALARTGRIVRFWWGSVFLINVPIAVVAACALWLIPNSKNPAALPPDLAGALLSIAGLGLLLWCLIEAPVRSWSSPLVIGAGVGGHGGPDRVRCLGAEELAPDAEHPVLPAQAVLWRGLLGGPGHVRPVRRAVRANPVPPVQPGLFGAAGRGPGAARGRGHRGRRSPVYHRDPRRRDRAHGGGRTADRRRRPVAAVRRPRPRPPSPASCPASSCSASAPD